MWWEWRDLWEHSMFFRILWGSKLKFEEKRFVEKQLFLPQNFEIFQNNHKKVPVKTLKWFVIVESYLLESWGLKQARVISRTHFIV